MHPFCSNFFLSVEDGYIQKFARVSILGNYLEIESVDESVDESADERIQHRLKLWTCVKPWEQLQSTRLNLHCTFLQSLTVLRFYRSNTVYPARSESQGGTRTIVSRQGKLLRIEMENYSHQHENGKVLNRTSMDIDLFKINIPDEI